LKSGNIGTVTCSNSQAEQPFSILLSNERKTREVQVTSFMKELYLLSNFEMGWKEYGIALYKGGNRDIHIYGVFGSPPPDIKELPVECFDITTVDDIIASVSVYDNINLQGLENGDTWMEVSLKNDKNFAGASFPVRVAESCPMLYTGTFDIGEDHVITFGIEDKNNDGFFDDFLDCRYYESGHLSRSTPAIDGKLQGIETTYYESGKVYAEYPFTMSKVEGLAKAYYESGQLYYSVPYINDIEEGEYREYYESGQLYYSVPYVNGVREGEYRDFYKSGQLYRKIPYVNDIQEGTVYGYYESGQLNFEIPYVNDQKNGTEIYYYTNGDYSLYPWVNGQINGNSPGYTKESNGYMMTSCDIYVNDVIIGSCMPPK
jgi:antitoxin component YwqK of YwqJK toxin-antitoxin module